LLVAIVFVAGVLSALLVNDTICLMFTPLVVQLTLDARLKPLPFLLALAFGANAGSVATPTGNPQNMIIGTLSGISYARFVGALALPALVSLGLVAVVLLLLFHKDLPARPLSAVLLPRPDLNPPLAILCLLTLAGLVVAFLMGANLAWTAITGAAFLVVVSRRPARQVFEKIDGILLLFFGGLFIIVFGVGKAGVAQAMFDGLRPFFGDAALRQAFVFGVFTIVISQIVSNVPFVILSAHWMANFADPTFMWLSTALFSTLAGNLTIIGSVANLIVLDGAKEHGKIGALQFAGYGTLVTSATILCGFGVLWMERQLGWF
jgi:Na+/H+ antiporter NhaD/arsenite permease-like protein